MCRIREIAQESIKFMKHSRREYLTTEDINHALKLRNIEVLYGFSASEPSKFSKVLTPTQAIYFVQEKELDFQEIIAAALPKCPREPSLSIHWLSLEGVQPLIPQNPSPIDLEPTNKRARKDTLDLPTGGTTTTPTSAGIEGVGSTTVRPTVRHVLAKEIQMFFEKIVAAIKGDDIALFEAALTTLKTDSSLHQLLPYFTGFLASTVAENMTDLELLMRLMRMARALIESPHLKTDIYLHQIMPSILSCMVGRKLCASPTDNHWRLRDYVAELVSTICKKFGDTYPLLQGRITKTLVKCLHDTTKPLTSHYGAIVGLTALGRQSIQFLLIPHIPKYNKLIDHKLKVLEADLNNHPNDRNKYETVNQTKYETSKVLDSLVIAIGQFLSWVSKGENVLTVLDINKDKIPKTFDHDSVFSSILSILFVPLHCLPEIAFAPTLQIVPEKEE
eukprot:gene16865-20050_t